MSNKLKKRSLGYDKAKEEIKKEVKEKGGVNISPSFMKQFTESEDEETKITENEFYSVLSELSEKENFTLYKVYQISNGKESRALMICDTGTSIAFVKKPDEKEETVTEK